MKRPLQAAVAALAMLMPGQPANAAPSREAAVSALFEAALHRPGELRMFLRTMPKGGDLHNHLGGTIYAEDYLGWAASSGLCVVDAALAPPPCPPGHAVGEVMARDPEGYGRLVDRFSTRGWQAGVGRGAISGHDQFFGAFDRFGLAARGHTAEALVVARRIAAGDRLLYLELDHNPEAMSRYVMASPDVPLDEAGLAARFDVEMAALGPVLAQAVSELDSDERKAASALGCAGTTPDPACGIAVRYIGCAFRALPPAAVFRSLILSFALADRDLRFVGVNIVQPEDWPVALRDYDLHMAMFRFLEGKFPKVHRSLHAGELAFGLVSPGELKDHIAKAVASGAQRIGHGVDIAYEEDARGTLARMAREAIAVEINLSSNDVILGVKGGQHPVQLYRRMGVPTVLSTDDQGVLRTDMTNEYMRAASEQGFGYRDLKAAARASLEYSFLAGESLWAAHKLGVASTPCAASFTATPCRRLAAGSDKARLQILLEEKLREFEVNTLAKANKYSA